ncbi:MAG: hypothetical protein ACK4E8_06415 [Lacibacter sp.]
MYLIKNYLRFIYHSPRHAILHVLFLITIGFLVLETQHENTLHYNIIRVLRQETRGQHDTVYIRKLMTTINTMMYNRYYIFKGTERLSWKNNLFHSVDADIMYGAGACGGFSKVLARALSLSGYKVRIGQMKVMGKYGGHIIVEVMLPTTGTWAVIDPLYLLTFTNPKTGYWAGFEEVKANWQLYQRQINIPYNHAYAYEDVRYTNWQKVPVLGGFAYKTLSLLIGPNNAATFSARVWMLNKYYLYLIVTLLLYAAYHIYTFRRYAKKRTQNKKNETLQVAAVAAFLSPFLAVYF